MPNLKCVSKPNSCGHLKVRFDKRHLLDSIQKWKYLSNNPVTLKRNKDNHVSRFWNIKNVRCHLNSLFDTLCIKILELLILYYQYRNSRNSISFNMKSLFDVSTWEIKCSYLHAWLYLFHIFLYTSYTRHFGKVGLQNFKLLCSRMTDLGPRNVV